MSNLPLFGPCSVCELEHADGDWSVCDDCAEPGLRAWLRWMVDHCDTEAVLGAMVAKRLWGAA